MAAKFYFYPMPVANHLVTIDLGEDLAEYYSEMEYTKESAQSMNRKIHQTTTLNREVITIVRDRMSGGEDLAHKLYALQNQEIVLRTLQRHQGLFLVIQTHRFSQKGLGSRHKSPGKAHQ